MKGTMMTGGRIRKLVAVSIVAPLALIAGMMSAEAETVDDVTDGTPHGWGGPPWKSELKDDFGHYFNTRPANTPEDMADLCGNTGVEGVVWRQTWSQVEPTVGEYDFGGFDDVLEVVPSDCKLFLFVEWKSFPSSKILNPCPADLQEDYSALNANGGGVGYTCFMWEQEVVDRFNDMQTALADEFDGNRQVEGLILQETALGFNGAFSQDVAAGGTYTPAAFHQALSSIYGTCSSEFSTSWCVPFMNFFPGDQGKIRDVADEVEQLPNVCLSGPDLLPSNDSLYLNEDRIYEVLVDYDGCRSNSAQNDSYGQTGPGGGVNDICDDPDPNCTMDEIWQFGVGGTFGDFDQDDPFDSGVCVNGFFFWNHTVVPSATGLTFEDALPVIEDHPYGLDWTLRCKKGGLPLNFPWSSM